ncbi:MAG: hypothetical protein KKF67_02755 [Nanoarchaeota archaeon]|nr:hypothetical protein [Nanoarchaeota archaeon]
MKIYVAASFEKKKEVLEIYQRLKQLGHKISGDWTAHKFIRPYKENQELAKQYSIEDINGIKNCDIFILIPDEISSRGKYIEFGAAVLSNIKSSKPIIYVVGKFNSDSIFYFHPQVKRVDSIDEVLKEIDKI